ncbi:hypothetical protein M885DRAFT_579359, partial [Pelagophyceae sp. CCMP2097]
AAAESESSSVAALLRHVRRGDLDSSVAALLRHVRRVDLDAAPRPRRRGRAAAPVSESGGHFDAAAESGGAGLGAAAARGGLGTAAARGVLAASASGVPAPLAAFADGLGTGGLGTAAARGVLAASASGVPLPLAAFSEASTVRAPALADLELVPDLAPGLLIEARASRREGRGTGAAYRPYQTEFIQFCHGEGWSHAVDGRKMLQYAIFLAARKVKKRKRGGDGGV